MRFGVRSLAVLAIALMIPALVAAQTESGKVTGSVTDQSGAVLPGVTVNLKSVERASTRSTVTNAQGEYVFASLVPGTYEVTAELSGFSTKQTRTTVPVGATVAVNVQMAVGAQTEVITVVGETAAAINTSTQDIATTVTEAQIRELPTITRNPYDLVQLSGQARRPTAHRPPRHRLRHQRRPLGQHERASRRLRQQRRVHGHRRPGRPARLRAGVLGHHLELLGSVRPRDGRHRKRGHEIGDEPVPRHGLRLPPERRPRDQHASTTRPTRSTRASSTATRWASASAGRSRKTGSTSSRASSTSASARPTPRSAGSRRPSSSRRARPRRRPSSSAYGGGATINGPILTRGDVSAIVGTDGRGLQQPAGRPARLRPGPQKSLPIDAGGGDPQNNYQLVGPSRTSA